MRRLAAVLLAAIATIAAACATSTPAATDTTLRVFAASSLTEAFTAIARDFEAANDSVDVELTFAGSSSLARQIADGAPAHVFASADVETMDAAVHAGDVRDPVEFARNRMALIVEKANAHEIDELTDLDRTGIVYVVCAPAVPCGRYAASARERAGVDRAPASLEENVKAVVAKVAAGEADAGIVFATDARAAREDIVTVPDPTLDDEDLEAHYMIAVTSSASGTRLAAAWIDFVRGDAGRRALAAFGFLPGARA
jgi:molybdate transport system substrate-binding protein